MSSDQYARKAQSLRDEIAKLEGKSAAAMKREADLRSAASRAVSNLPRNASPTTIQNRTRDADSKNRSADRERDRVVELQKQIARKQGDLAQAEKSLTSERAREVKAEEHKLRRETEAARRKSEQLAKKREREIADLHREVGTLQGQLGNVTAALQRELPSVVTVLILYADPTAGLRLDREMRAIHNAVRLSEQRDHVRLESRWAVRPADISQAILDIRPDVVHFSGHGTDQSALVFEGDDGEPRVIAPEDLAGLVRAIGQCVRVILYNACWSAEAATAMADRVEVAIGMDAPVTDQAATAFAEGFYRAVGSGESVAAAFEVGRFEMRNTPQTNADEAEPVLVCRSDVDPQSVFLVAPSTGDLG